MQTSGTQIPTDCRIRSRNCKRTVATRVVRWRDQCTWHAKLSDNARRLFIQMWNGRAVAGADQRVAWTISAELIPISTSWSDLANTHLNIFISVNGCKFCRTMTPRTVSICPSRKNTHDEHFGIVFTEFNFKEHYTVVGHRIDNSQNFE